MVWYDDEDNSCQKAVIDNGTGYLKGGLAGEPEPSHMYRACVGYVKPGEGGEVPKVINGEPAQDYYVAPSMMIEPYLKLNFPVEHGIVDSWDDMEKIWGHLFYDCLQANVGHQPSGQDDIYGDEDCEVDAVLMTEAAMNPKKNREMCTSIMFEKFQVDKFYLAIQAILALYSSGRMTGLALDVGAGVTHTVPIFESYVMSFAVQRHNLAGRDLTNYAIRLLQEHCGCYLTTSAEKEQARRIKEECCYVSLDYDNEIQNYSQNNFYSFPDGQEIDIKEVAIKVPELLFNPRMHNYEYDGLPELCANTIMNTDMDLRKELWSSIILSGGTTCFPHLPERLEADCRELNQFSPVHVIQTEEKKYAVWQGGSVLASLASFDTQWMTRTTNHYASPVVQGYDEVGPRLVHMMCAI
eukprot:TRINITY_DN13221_c0_g1_i3.p1 TRINITY_DN13221_c0_g1~~TRINITY_DN13221_c0_g1_i3.p1  ORF type:complete len:410 (+),score=102.31 TRINITY_DN13221_c0_g1_i3:232-1461(+)